LPRTNEKKPANWPTQRKSVRGKRLLGADPFSGSVPARGILHKGKEEKSGSGWRQERGLSFRKTLVRCGKAVLEGGKARGERRPDGGQVRKPGARQPRSLSEKRRGKGVVQSSKVRSFEEPSTAPARKRKGGEKDTPRRLFLSRRKGSGWETQQFLLLGIGHSIPRAWEENYVLRGEEYRPIKLQDSLERAVLLSNPRTGGGKVFTKEKGLARGKENPNVF